MATTSKISQASHSYLTYDTFCKAPKPWGEVDESSIFSRVKDNYPDELKTELKNRKIQILAQIGDGFFGVVLAVKDQASNVGVLKVKRRSQFNSKDFSHEIIILKQVQEYNIPNVVEFYGSISTSCFAMEYMAADLAQVVSRVSSFAPFSMSQIKTLLHSVLVALEAIETKLGYHHLDLRPDNILVDWHKGKKDPVFKLADFGLARKKDELLPYYEYGVIDYRSPGALTLQTKGLDTFALGCTALEALSGRVFFYVPEERGDKNIQLMIRKVFSAVHPPSPQWIQQIPEDIKLKGSGEERFIYTSIEPPHTSIWNAISSRRGDLIAHGKESEQDLIALGSFIVDLLEYENPKTLAQLLEDPYFKDQKPIERDVTKDLSFDLSIKDTI